MSWLEIPSPLMLIIGTLFQVVVGVWPPVILNLMVLYASGYSYALSMCRILTSFSWTALMAMVWLDCEMLFAYSFVLTSIFLAPALGSEVTRTSIFLAVCGGATPLLFTRQLSREHLVDYKAWSIDYIEQAFIRIMATLKRSGFLWPVLVVACEGVSIICLIAAFFGFKGNLIFDEVNTEAGKQFEDYIYPWVIAPSGFLACVTILEALNYLRERVERAEARREPGYQLKPSESAPATFGLIIVHSGICFVDFGVDIIYYCIPPYRGSFMNSPVGVFAIRYVIFFFLFSKGLQWKLEEESAGEKDFESASQSVSDGIEMNGSIIQSVHGTSTLDDLATSIRGAQSLETS